MLQQHSAPALFLVLLAATCVAFTPLSCRPRTCIRARVFECQKHPLSLQCSQKLRMSSTELPDSLEDCVVRAAARTCDMWASGQMRAQVTVDTSLGDITYTLLKQTMHIVGFILLPYAHIHLHVHSCALQTRTRTSCKSRSGPPFLEGIVRAR
jgi:hypothetical protein